MTTPEDPFDKTVWDPKDREHAIEDPFHGPSAVFDVLQTPPMPLGVSSGLYYQPGGYYVCGTPYSDALNQPVHIIGGRRSAAEIIRQTERLKSGDKLVMRVMRRGLGSKQNASGNA